MASGSSEQLGASRLGQIIHCFRHRFVVSESFMKRIIMVVAGIDVFIHY